MSQMMEEDLSFAPLGAEQEIEAAVQSQQAFSLIDAALQQVRNVSNNVIDFPSIYDEKLRQLIDAVPME